MISIIVPYYKLHFFSATLISIAEQSDKRFHVYIFDDNSPEDPRTLLDKFRGKFEFTYHKFNENIGKTSLVQHWVRCIDSVPTTEWIIILGDDDVLERNVIHDFYQNLPEIESLHINVVRYASVVIDQYDHEISKRYEHPQIENAIESFMKKLQNTSRSSLSEHFFRRSVFDNYVIRDFPNALCADDIMILEHSAFKNIFTINSSLIKIRKSTLNLSGGGVKLVDRHYPIIQFYTLLLTEFKTHFSKEQISIIESKFEREIFIHKKIVILVFFIKYYISNLKFAKLFKLLFYIFVKFPKLILNKPK